jgi:hypothetical protein
MDWGAGQPLPRAMDDAIRTLRLAAAVSILLTLSRSFIVLRALHHPSPLAAPFVIRHNPSHGARPSPIMTSSPAHMATQRHSMQTYDGLHLGISRISLSKRFAARLDGVRRARLSYNTIQRTICLTAVFTCFEQKIGVGVQGKSNGGDGYETLLDGFTDTRRPGL